MAQTRQTGRQQPQAQQANPPKSGRTFSVVFNEQGKAVKAVTVHGKEIPYDQWRALEQESLKQVTVSAITVTEILITSNPGCIVHQGCRWVDVC